MRQLLQKRTRWRSGWIAMPGDVRRSRRRENNPSEARRQEGVTHPQFSPHTLNSYNNNTIKTKLN